MILCSEKAYQSLKLCRNLSGSCKCGESTGTKSCGRFFRFLSHASHNSLRYSEMIYYRHEIICTGDKFFIKVFIIVRHQVSSESNVAMLIALVKEYRCFSQNSRFPRNSLLLVRDFRGYYHSEVWFLAS
jgi:hypothetical protein